MVFLHAASSALLNPIGLVIADQLKRAGFNVDVRTTDYATVAQRRLSRAPVEQGGWSVMPIVWNGIDLVNPLSNPAVSYICSESTRAGTATRRAPACCGRWRKRPTPRPRKALATQLQGAFHRNVNYVWGGHSWRRRPTGPS